MIQSLSPSQSSQSDKPLLTCPYCNIACVSKSGLTWHLKVHKKIHTATEGNINACSYPCNICGLTFPTTRTRTLHKRSVHKEAFPCDLCSKSFPNKTALKRHKQNHPAKGFKCTQCDKSLEHEVGLRAHIKVAHCYSGSKDSSSSLTCDICSESFEYEATLQQHYEQHINLKTFQCSVCAANLSTTPSCITT